MVLYESGNITISTLEDSDKAKVLEYFAENSFNCDYEMSGFRPSNDQFMAIMNMITAGDDQNAILVLKDNGEVIGYASMFVEYDKLTIGHIAVKKSERGKGYGELLTRLAVAIAENEDRDVAVFCNYPNRYLPQIGFVAFDQVHYLYRRNGLKNPDLPTLFVTTEDYRRRKELESQAKLAQFVRFLDSGMLRHIVDDPEIKR